MIIKDEKVGRYGIGGSHGYGSYRERKWDINNLSQEFPTDSQWMTLETSVTLVFFNEDLEGNGL